MFKKMFVCVLSVFLFFWCAHLAISSIDIKVAETKAVEDAPADPDLLEPSSVDIKDESEEIRDKATDLAVDQKNSEFKKNDLYSQIELFSYALTTVKSEYAEEPTARDLIYGALKGMLGSLDPHSQFLDPEDYKELKTETQGKFGGLGIEISIRDGLLTVITPLDDSPASKAGVKAGDRIVKIEDELTKDLDLNDAVKKLRGKPGTDIHITVLREDEFKIHEFTITRDVIHIQDIKDVTVLEDNIGYIRLAEFREDTDRELKKSLLDLKSKNADSLILDLRNDPGGLLNVAIDVAEEFLPAGQKIVSTKGRHPSQNIETYSKNTNGNFTAWPMVVLINEGSASGSEIVAGALKDNKRAVILGTKSFGKGSVQSVIPLPDGSGLRLTTSKYFTPSGTSIHGKGIEPDIVVKRVYKEANKKDDEQEAIDRLFEGIQTQKDKKDPAKDTEEKPNTDKSNKSDKPDDKKLTKEEETKKRLSEDNQIQTAVSVLKGIKVYHGIATPEKSASTSTKT